MEHNPYQAPVANIDGITDMDLASAEATRKEFINHEASVRSIGVLYYIGAVSALVVTVSLALTLEGSSDGASALALAFFIPIGLLYFWLGSGLRALNQKVRPVAGVFAAIGLIGFPLGTLINGYILYLLFSAKGKMVFSEEYQGIIDATPHVKYKTSIIVWLILALLVLSIAAAVMLPVLQG